MVGFVDLDDYCGFAVGFGLRLGLGWDELGSVDYLIDLYVAVRWVYEYFS